ncbi:hypothetical protein CVIRNUC_007852 [Coccomyxa viridis]|uniref:Protein kinase domain-containing protein n=1 Tax=Coccomyxa viridis TaxID=1274662 RepID=A0AAV1IFH4_9CHLO|nr:hypothetical protein CVIRNUC_007852 [Coccomyxa viridis]
MPVAVKALTSSDPEIAAAFASNIGALASLSHPHVVKHFTHIIGNGMALFCIQRDVLETLLVHLLLKGRLIALGVARGLAYLHSNSVLWFSCKPSNVLLDRSGAVAKIADFGLASFLAAMHSAEQMVSAASLSWGCSELQVSCDVEVAAGAGLIILCYWS